MTRRWRRKLYPAANAWTGSVALDDEWNNLAERGSAIFATALWNRLWWKHFGGDRELLLHAAYARVTAPSRLVLPLYAWRHRTPRVVRFLGHGPGDELGPVYAGRHHELAAPALRALLGALDWDVFLGEQLPGDEGWRELVGGRAWRREASPTLAASAASWEEYLGGRSANFRQQLRRREAALARRG